LPGLYIRLLDTGVASWVVQWKRLGRQKKIALGNVLVLDRLEAIKAAKDLLAKVQLDTLDPHKARRERMRANKVTFETVVPLLLQQKKDRGELKPSTEQNWKMYFTGYYFKPLHHLPIDEITAEQVQTQIDVIAKRSGNETAVACCAAMRVLFRWAIKTGKLPKSHDNPMDNVLAPARNQPRERVLDDDEIRLIWKTCEIWLAQALQKNQHKNRFKNPDYPRAIQLLFLTGCRRQEIGNLQFSEVNLDNAELFIPGSRRKSRKSKEREQDLHVPLADWAVQILRGIAWQPNDDHVFRRSRRRKKLPGLNLRSTHEIIDQRIAEAGDIPPPHWTIHDIRRTFRTKMAQLGIIPDVAEALVGHVGHRSKLVRTYNRYKYWPEKKLALAKWEDHLRAIIDGTAEKIAHANFGQRKGGAA